MPAFWKRKREAEVLLTDEETMRILDLWVSAWDALALSAWGGYLTSGRGFLLVDFTRNVTSYVSEVSPMMRGPHGAPWGDVLRRCKVYDPNTEIVVVLNGFISDASMQDLTLPAPDGRLSPPALHQRGVETAQVHDALAETSVALRGIRRDAV